MLRFLCVSLAIWLSSCVTAPPLVQPPVRTAIECHTNTVTQIRARMALDQATLRADLTDEPMQNLLKAVEPFLDDPLPLGTDQLLIFEKNGAAVIQLFHNGCALGYITGPWDQILDMLVQPKT